MLPLVVLSLFFAQSFALSAKEEAAHAQKTLALIGDTLATIEKPGSAHEIALNALLRNVAGATKITDNERAVFQNVSTILQDILDKLQLETNGQTGVFTVTDDAAACAIQQQGDEAAQAATVSNSQSAHANCRDDEATTLTALNAFCFQALGVVTSQTCRTDAPATHANTPFVAANYFESSHITGADGWVNFFDNAVTHYQTPLNSYQSTVETKCLNEQTDMQTLIDNCKTAQTTFETHYCTYEGWVYDKCKGRWDCYNGTIRTFEANKLTVASAGSWIVDQARIVTYAKCLVDRDLLLANYDTCVLLDASDVAFNTFRPVVPPSPTWTACTAETVKDARETATSYAGNFSGDWAVGTANAFLCDNSYSYPEFWGVDRVAADALR